MSRAILNRLRAMDGAELRFRARAAVRSQMGRARAAIAPETWRRDSLRLSDDAPRQAVLALERHDWHAAHLALAAHYAERSSCFPLDPRRLPELARVIRERFPDNEAAARADRIVNGRYDLLGYRDLQLSSPPDWQRDPVHGGRAPRAFWNSVPYLDPTCGDHKIVWELNRHQHFLALGRAHALTGDRRYYQTFVAHVTDWIRTNPPLAGTNWASMLELAFRCLSWIWALHFFARAASESDPHPWTLDLLLALDRQLTHVDQNLSRYFSPNTHLTGEALALYVAGRTLPELAAAQQYAATGRGVLVHEAYRQVLPDGGHAERSAHYHRYSTDFYLLALGVARASRDEAASAFEECVRRQARFLRALADDTGRLPLLGDDDGGQLFPICGRPPANATDSLATAAVLLGDPALLISPVPEETWWACGTSSPIDDVQPDAQAARSAAFPQTGYFISRDGRGGHLVFDAGRHGYLNGGHAHADALAVVLTVRGRPLLVDPGTATYTMDPAARDRFRSTAMHNTVVVNGRPQSVARGPFHWQSRTDAVCTVWRPGPRCDYVEGRHAGYAPITHVRGVAVLHGLGWIIVDHLFGAAAETSIVANWHVHPDWTLDRAGAHQVRLVHPDGATACLAASVPLRQESSSGLDEYAPVYGRIERGLCFSGELQARPPLSICTFIAEGPVRSCVQLGIDQPPAPGTRGAAFRIETPLETLIVLSSVELTDPSTIRPSHGGWGPSEARTTARASIFRLAEAGLEDLCSIPCTVASSVQGGE